MDQAEKDAILRVIERGTKAFSEGDVDGYSTCYSHAGYVTWWHSSPIDGNFVRRGWEETEPLLREWMTTGRRGSRGAEDRIDENHVIRVSDTIAWVMFTRRYPAERAHRAGPGPAYHLRILEKHEGEWRITLSGFLDPTAGAPRAPSLRLDASGSVLWMNAGGEAALAADADLVIRNRRLNIYNSQANRSLYAAIRWAEELGKELYPRRGALPIVLDAGEGSPAKVWWVVGDSGSIYFSFGESGREDRQLDAAAVVFRLSAAQKAIASYVVRGHSLEESAHLMGIKQSSARTHLDRVFEKTGVRTQGALIRVLLSVAPPI